VGHDLQTRLLTASGGTSVAAGLLMAQKVLREREYRNPVSAVMLLSDGCDGGGKSPCEHVASKLRDAGTSVYTWGCVAVDFRTTRSRNRVNSRG
jgi:Mg-chelatase subunit ChlD